MNPQIDQIHLFSESLNGKFSLRFHMSVILLGTAFAGSLIYVWLRDIGLDLLLLRLPLALILVYPIFFVYVKIWLIYITPAKNRTNQQKSSWLDRLEFTTTADNKNSPPREPFLGKGGQFSGAGASSSFVSDQMNAVEKTNDTGEASSNKNASSSDSNDGWAKIMTIALIIVILASVTGTVSYLIFKAPRILSEVAFQYSPALSDAENANKKTAWKGKLFANTWLPYSIMLLVFIIVGIVF